MKTTRQVWFRSLLLAFGLWSVANCARAQADDTNNTTADVMGTHATQMAEEPAVAERRTDRFEEWPNASGRIWRGELVVIGRDVVLTKAESAETVVVIGGSATIDGVVRDAVVAVGGNLIVNGEVGHEAVAVLGNLKIGPGAKLGGDTVVVAGTADVSPDAHIHGRIEEIDTGRWGFPTMEWLKQWFTHCALKLRPLAPQVGWVWVVAGVFSLIYLLVAMVFPRPVQSCLDTLTHRPATSFFVGLLMQLLVPLVTIVLAITVIGVLAIPFVQAAILFGVIVGKVALLEYVGGAIGRQFGLEMLRRPLAACFLGLVLLTLFYIVPVLGFVTFGVFGLWGLGVAVTATFSGVRRERRETRPASTEIPPGGGSVASTPVPVESAPALSTSGGGAGEGTAPAVPNVAQITQPPVQTHLPPALAYPRVGFWERMGAAFLDVVLVCIPMGIIGPFVLLFALAYFSGMWTWKGTTIGGIVLRLKVVRSDGAPMTFLVALVRALAAAFSAAFLFLGFFWIGWDRDKQGWHDKIAGTVVLRLPQSLPLVCL